MKKKIGLALSGGGARGIAHLGAIKAMEAQGISFSMISGTSAGAIIGSLYAYGYTPDEVMAIIAKTGLLKTLRPAWVKTGLLKLDALEGVLQKYMPENRFEMLKTPLVVAATEIRQGKTVYFSDGELIKPILASSCIPVIFDPIRFDGQMFVDGGILDNLPTTPLEGRCDVVIGCHCNPIDEALNVANVKAVVERSLLMAINGNTLISKSRCDVLIEPKGLGKYSAMDLGKAQELFDIGYAYTQSYIERVGLDELANPDSPLDKTDA